MSARLVKESTRVHNDSLLNPAKVLHTQISLSSQQDPDLTEGRTFAPVSAVDLYLTDVPGFYYKHCMGVSGAKVMSPGALQKSRRQGRTPFVTENSNRTRGSFRKPER
jgi:hypothetical protein